MFLPHFDVFCDLSLNRRTVTWNLFVLYNNEKPFLFQNFSTIFNAICPAFAPIDGDDNKPFDVIYYLYRMKQFYWLLCVANNCDWSRKTTPLSWNETILKKMLEKPSQFLSSEQPGETKGLDVALKIAGVEKIPSENLWLRST